MTYGFLFSLISAVCVYCGMTSEGWLGVCFYSYLAFSFFSISVLYFLRPSLRLLKKPDGRLRFVNWLFLFPYLVFSRVSFLLHTLTSNEDSVNQVDHNLYLGRWHWPFEARKLETLEIASVLDLTWEFDFPRKLKEGRTYLNLPVLDSSAPTFDQLQKAIEWLKYQRETGSILVHCALGHGRSATVVVAFLLAIKQAKTLDEAIHTVAQNRVKIGLNKEQQIAVLAYMKTLR